MPSPSPATRGPGGADPSRAVIDAVASAEDADPSELDPLNDVIDPDALNGLFADRDVELGRVVFRYHGYTVTVDRHGRVTLDGG